MDPNLLMVSPPASPEHEPARPKQKNDYRFCLPVIDRTREIRSLNWMLVHIPYRKVLSILRTLKSEPITRYVHHQHYLHDDTTKWRFANYKADPTTNGPFLSEIHLNCRTAAIGSTVYAAGGDEDNFPRHCLQIISNEYWSGVGKPSMPLHLASHSHVREEDDSDGFCYNTRFSDLSEESSIPPRWQVIDKPFNFPRLHPNMVTFGGKLYAFGGNCPTEGVAFGEVFDPEKGCWETISQPTFGRMSCRTMAVIPLGGDWQKLLVLNKKTADVQTLYCTYYDSWDDYYHPGFKWGLASRMGNVKGEPVSVPEHNTFYWLDGWHKTICAFNWQTCEMFEGFLIGLWHERAFSTEYDEPFKTLFHLKEDLFCLM